MTNFLEIIKLLAAMYPILMQTIKALEEAIPDDGHGAQKLAMLKGTLEAAYVKMDNTKMKFEEVWPSISMLVATIVTIFNTTGVFKKK